MQTPLHHGNAPPCTPPIGDALATTGQQFQVIRRNGAVVPFESIKIALAMKKAFLATQGEQGATSVRIRDSVNQYTEKVVSNLLRRKPEGGAIHIEDIQDQVERILMQSGAHDVARAYVLYREERARKRLASLSASNKVFDEIHIIDYSGNTILLDQQELRTLIHCATKGVEVNIDEEFIFKETLKNLYNGVSINEVYKSVILAARQMIEKDPAYSLVTARLLLHTLRQEVLGQPISHEQMQKHYAIYFPLAIQRGVKAGMLDKRLLQFDFDQLGAALVSERDYQFNYLGLQTLYDRYFLHIEERRIELPQTFFMRVAMGLALHEENKNARAIEFYQVLSSFDFMSSTPTLFNSGTCRPQLSSCYLTTVADDLEGIYESLKENALLSKFAGGLGNDWTAVRAMGAHIKGTNGKSQGVVPFLKVVNDTAVAVNQGGKRKGAVCAYLEVWHADIEEFLELRKNTGDDRRRTHDMNSANWIPDLFMKRVHENGEWTLFDPSETPDLHDKYGQAFEQAYLAYEAKAAKGEMKIAKVRSALTLWRKMLSMLFETGHPWITFKDPCNIRNPQQHVGVIHSSNLCTEITLNTNSDEIAVCNLGSINLVNHLDASGLNIDKLQQTIRTAIRMLDNVIDINFYPVPKAKHSNLLHRPIGLGMMGYQDCLHKLRIPYASEAALKFADHSMELIAFHAYWASTELAKERGTYSTYQGSLWDQGILPQDSLALLRQSRGGYLELDTTTTLEWDKLREHIRLYGMRNSNCLAIAPTATIANIVGVSASIEPTYQNLFVKSNLSGEFTIVNTYLVKDLKALDLWDEVMIADLKYFNGSLVQIDRIPQALRELYATAFEIDPKWLVKAAARRQKWIDQSQSLNLYMAGVSGKQLDELYRFAWTSGLKTTYYLRTLAASSAEKSTGQGGELNAVAIHNPADIISAAQAAICSINDPECEACQ